MKTKIPADLAKVTDIDKLLSDLLAERTTLLAIKDEELTDEQLDDIDEIGAAVATLETEKTSRATKAAERAERIKTTRAAAEAESGEEDPEEDPEDESTDSEVEEPVEDEPVIEDEIIVPDDASELEGAELVTASGATKNKSVARAVAKRAPVQKSVAIKAQAVATVFAAGDIGGFQMGQELKGIPDIAKAFQSKFNAMPKSRGRKDVQNRYGVATINKAVDERTHIKRGMDAEAAASAVEFAVKMYKEDRGFISEKSLTAAGGWCAPSQTVYNMAGLETVNGILTMPEVTIEHGGIQFTKGPDYATVTADADTHFLQTETQAEAGATKPLYDIECPDFDEARLDAIGWGFRAGILTKAAWPELIGRYEQVLMTGFEHYKNRDLISRVVGMLGTALTPAAIGAAFVDSLNALSRQALNLRYRYSMSDIAVIDGFAPIWLKEVFKDDLAYQNGVDRLSVTDAQIDGWLSNRHISLQWVYDWQDSTFVTTTPALTFPTTAQVALFPAGSYVKGSADVINLDAIYDTAGIQINTYTGMFVEEGVLVYNPVGSGVLVTLPIPATSILGATGYPAIGAKAGVSFAPPAA